MVDYTVDKLVADVKRHGSVPTSQDLFSEDDFAEMLDHNQRTSLIPQIMKQREEYFVATSDIPLVVGNNTYSVPARSVAAKVRSIWVVDAMGNEAQLSRIEPENKSWHENYIWWPGSKSGYRWEANTVILTPNLSTSYITLRFKYFRRPNRLVLKKNAGQVTAIDTGTGIITVDNVLSTWVTGSKVDLIKGTPNFDSYSDSFALLGVSGSTVTVSLALAAKLSVGDWICNESETPVPQYAEEYSALLVSQVTEEVLRSLGDLVGAQAEGADRQDLKDTLNELGGNRDEGAPRKIVSRRGIWDTGGI